MQRAMEALTSKYICAKPISVVCVSHSWANVLVTAKQAKGIEQLSYMSLQQKKKANKAHICLGAVVKAPE